MDSRLFGQILGLAGLLLLVAGATAQQSKPLNNAPQPELFGEGAISTGEDESHPAFTPDGATLYFCKNTPTFDHWTIVISTLASGKWSTPRVAPFSGQYRDADPFITPDGERLYFISNRPVDGRPKEDNDIWFMRKTPEGWSVPEHAGPLVNSDQDEWLPTIANNGTLYFGSEREGGKGRSDLYRARMVDGKFAAPENLGDKVNSAAGEFEPIVSGDETFMIFAAVGRPDSRGAFDLYVSYFRDQAWSAPESLPINSAGWDFSPKFSPDGKWFYFTSSRSFTERPLEKALNYDQLLEKIRAPGNGLRDIYRIDVRELKLRP